MYNAAYISNQQRPIKKKQSIATMPLLHLTINAISLIFPSTYPRHVLLVFASIIIKTNLLGVFLLIYNSSFFPLSIPYFFNMKK